MASERILVFCLILACFVSMAKADAPRSEDVSDRVKRLGLSQIDISKSYRSPFSKDCAPKPETDYRATITDGRKFEHFFDCFSYNGHKYYISLRFYTDLFETQRICQSFDGYLVQINYVAEFQAIKNYLGNITKEGDYHDILIQGTDMWKEGMWTFFDMSPLAVIDWYPGDPDEDDCMCLSAKTGKMFAVWCNVPDAWLGGRYPYRFMCEIPA